MWTNTTCRVCKPWHSEWTQVRASCLSWETANSRTAESTWRTPTVSSISTIIRQGDSVKIFLWNSPTAAVLTSCSWQDNPLIFRAQISSINWNYKTSTTISCRIIWPMTICAYLKTKVWRILTSIKPRICTWITSRITMHKSRAIYWTKTLRSVFQISWAIMPCKFRRYSIPLIPISHLRLEIPWCKELSTKFSFQRAKAASRAWQISTG